MCDTTRTNSCVRTGRFNRPPSLCPHVELEVIWAGDPKESDVYIRNARCDIDGCRLTPGLNFPYDLAGQSLRRN